MSNLPTYPRVKGRMKADALNLRRRVDALNRMLATADANTVNNVAYEIERLANCIAADAREVSRVSQMRLMGGVK